ncbi:MAG: hypothetical protein GXO12_04895 [Epsilonproteobacteria bacterium]|nr:hypothetical protein [Campylobacterota bacterium]
MKNMLILIIAVLFDGCLYVNDTGISTRYYNDCHEYYDSMGIYHKECPKNLIDYKDLQIKLDD